MPNVKKHQRKDSDNLNREKEKGKQYRCAMCNESVENEGVGCDICGNWFHFKCEELSDEQYAQMVKPETKFMH